jgi:hypothetical protein
MGRRGFVVVLLALAVGAGCSSSTAPRASQATTTTRATPARTVAPAPSPRQRATALTQRLSGVAVLPPGARRTETPLPQILRGPWQVLAGGNVVTTKRAWLVPGSPGSVMAFLTAHIPRGLRGGGRGSVSSPTERVDYVVDELSRLPPNIFAAGIEIGAEPRGTGSLVNVVAGAQWTPVRPAAELVAARDAVSIRALHPYPAHRPPIRRVVVTGASARAITRAFNALRVEPVGVVHGCPAITARSVSYQIEFARSARAEGDVVADYGPCGDIGVTVRGRRALTLSPSEEFDDAIAQALGVPELHFFR